MCTIKDLKLDRETYNFFKTRATIKEKTIESEIITFLKNQVEYLKHQPFEDVLE